MANVCCKVGTPCATSQCCPRNTLWFAVLNCLDGASICGILGLRLYENLKASLSRHFKTILKYEVCIGFAVASNWRSKIVIRWLCWCASWDHGIGCWWKWARKPLYSFFFGPFLVIPAVSVVEKRWWKRWGGLLSRSVSPVFIAVVWLHQAESKTTAQKQLATNYGCDHDAITNLSCNTYGVIFTEKKTREKWKWFWTVPRQLDFVEFLQLMSCLVAHLSAFSVGFWVDFNWPLATKDGCWMMFKLQLQVPILASFFFAHPEGFWSMNPWNLTASPWLSEDQNRRAGQSSEFGCLGGNRLGTMLNAELLARHLRFLRGFSCFGCFGKWMKINWLFIRKHTSIGWKLTFYHINLYFFVLFSWIFFHEGLPQVDFPA